MLSIVMNGLDVLGSEGKVKWSASPSCRKVVMYKRSDVAIELERVTMLRRRFATVK
jgi:hypothetical protein